MLSGRDNEIQDIKEILGCRGVKVVIFVKKKKKKNKYDSVINITDIEGQVKKEI